ncbi:hypothetical protein MSG28_012615 [Choristoneura fumiferana]|uniref:Uncharacterized protein n=1 Tax=Choristoneura fumiferana TaxID=7141 RepID=A0ACC0JHE1_CHOFU|nr:hypothetical protein MSG28_012615 [Choristoneura fumiferana]
MSTYTNISSCIRTSLLLTLCLWIITIYFCVLSYRLVTAPDPIGPIRAFIQTNLVGLPVIHGRQTWEFDPDVALRRRRQFIELHGDKGEKLIERLGLGIDGFEDERLKMQRQRDDGHLGGLNYFLP